MSALFSLLLLGASAAHASNPGRAALEQTLGDAPSWSVDAGGDAPRTPWWTAVDDPGLSAVLDEALSSSPTVRASWERVKVAHAGQWQVGSALMPTAGVSATWNELATDSLIVQVTNSNPAFTEALARDVFGDSYNTYNTALQANWTVDLFGATTTAWLSSRWDWRAAERSRAAQAVGVAGSVGGAWYDLVMASEQLATVEDQLRTSQELTGLVQLRYEGGEARGLDLLQQKQQLANTEAALPAARAAVDRTLWRLAALLGRDPSRARTQDYRLPDRLPPAPALPGLGSPADLLDRRPDLAASVAATKAADLGRLSSWLNLAPAVTLGGNTGESGQMLGADTDEWTTWSSWSVTANATVPLFNGGRKVAAARGASAGYRQALYTLQADLLTAVSEVEDSRRVVVQRTEELDARTAQLDAARLAFDESRSQYLGGLLPYVNVQTALNTLQVAELSHLRARRELLTAHIVLHNALGAPWAFDLDRPGRMATGGQ